MISATLSETPTTLEAIIAPTGVELFHEKMVSREPMCIRGFPEKFGELISWEVLNDILASHPAHPSAPVSIAVREISSI
jgi:hypothetical protein